MIQTVISHSLSQFLFYTLSGSPFLPSTSSLRQSSVFIFQWIQPVVTLPLRIPRISKPAIISLTSLPSDPSSVYQKTIPAWEMGTQLGPRTESSWYDSTVNRTLFDFWHEKNTFPLYTYTGAREAPSVWTDGLCEILHLETVKGQGIGINCSANHQATSDVNEACPCEKQVCLIVLN